MTDTCDYSMLHEPHHTHSLGHYGIDAVQRVFTVDRCRSGRSV